MFKKYGSTDYLNQNVECFIENTGNSRRFEKNGQKESETHLDFKN